MPPNMKQPLFLKSFLFFGLLWIWSSTAAQTPTSDSDSIAEDSYRHILEWQTKDTLSTEIRYPNFIPPRYNGFLGSYIIADVPSPRGEGIIGYVSDPDDIIPELEEQRINELLYELEQKSSVEVAVVMLPSIGQDVPKSFAVDLFQKWGIGKSDTDNGLLILTVMDQRRTEFEVGYGLEGILTDVVCYRIGVNEIVPYFKQGDFGAGIESAVLRIKEFLENPEAIDEVYGYNIVHEEQPFEWRWYHFLLILYGVISMVMGFWYFGQAFDIQLSKDDYYDKYHRLDKLKFGCTDILFPLPMLFFARMAKKRLEKYRYAPRFSKMNGKPMTLLTNYDEIDYLEEVQLLEEELKSILYDVWITEDKGDIMVLEYAGPNGRKYTECNECGYKTFGKINSLILVFATSEHGGSRIDKYECRNCNYKEEKEVQTPKKYSSNESSSSSGSSFSSSSSSSSSSSFGGGSSGGGGAGVSW